MLDFNENPAVKTSSGLGTEPVQVEYNRGSARGRREVEERSRRGRREVEESARESERAQGKNFGDRLSRGMVLLPPGKNLNHFYYL